MRSEKAVRRKADDDELVRFQVVRIEVVEEEQMPRWKAAALKKEFNAEARREQIAERAILVPAEKAAS